MTYYAYLKQGGEGCDYTIGCGEHLIKIKANSDDDAKIKLTEIISEDYTGDNELVKVILFKDTITFDLGAVYSDLYDKAATAKEKRQYIKDMADFEKLKAKLNK